jgi:hypothetical protein
VSDVVAALGAVVDHALAQHGGAAGQAGHPFDDVDDQVKAVHVVEHEHVEGCGGAFLLVRARGCCRARCAGT